MGKSLFAKFVVALALVATSCASFAQGLKSDAPTINISNGTASATPITVVPFHFEGASMPPETNVDEVISNDLNRCGQFRTLPKASVVEYPTRGSEIKFPT